MSTHYLVDSFASPVSSSRIIDVRDPANNQSLSNGVFVVRIPDGVQVVRPANFSDLITKKYAGLLGFYAGFTRVAFDDLVDATGINAATSDKFQSGSREAVALQPGGILESVIVPLTPGTPTQAVVTWETNSFILDDDSTNRVQRTYAEVPSTPSNITCSVSFNGGGSYNATTDGSVLNIPVPDQGLNFIIRLTNASVNKLFIGSWSVVY